jgi:hypothetical protein
LLQSFRLGLVALLLQSLHHLGHEPLDLANQARPAKELQSLFPSLNGQGSVSYLQMAARRLQVKVPRPVQHPSLGSTFSQSL